jgi:hypothetical protein
MLTLDIISDFGQLQPVGVSELPAFQRYMLLPPSVSKKTQRGKVEVGAPLGQ